MTVWSQGQWSSVDQTESSLEMQGDVYSMLAGIDGRWFDSFRTGLAIGYEYSDIATKYNNGTFRSSGVTAAPYFQGGIINS